MASRSSQFHTSLHRPRLIMGIERGTFAVLAMTASSMFALQLYFLMPTIVLLYLAGRWLSKVDAQYMAVLKKYIDEDHVYDATPRRSDLRRRPVGWGRDLPR